MNLKQAFVKNFLGKSPTWFKWTIVSFLILNPVLLLILGDISVDSDGQKIRNKWTLHSWLDFNFRIHFLSCDGSQMLPATTGRFACNRSGCAWLDIT